MNNKEVKQLLLTTFKNCGFEEAWNNKYINTLTYNVENEFNINLSIDFPGYKTKKNKYGLVYDYRVRVNQIPISHVNIVIDLYSKIYQMPVYKEMIKEFLIDVSRNGYDIDFGKYSLIQNYDYKPPTLELLSRVDKQCEKLGKRYQRSGNLWNYSLYELALMMTFISVQEDINYPMPRFEGRRMCFYRYLEAVSCRNIDDVIERTLAHYRPELFYNVDYTDVIELANIM